VLIRPFLGGGWGRIVAALAILAAPVAFSATLLFSKPLHLVRRVDDPIAKTSVTIDEYCVGNRVVTIRGSKTAIADYDAQQLTEIDHVEQTWSVTSFADIAKSRSDLDGRIGAGVAPYAAKVTELGRKTTSAVDAFVVEAPHRRMEIGFNRSVTLSRAAAEILIGAAYPNSRSQEQDAILNAAVGVAHVSAKTFSRLAGGPAIQASRFPLVTSAMLGGTLNGTR